jgi:hypothetical protein
MGAGAAMAPVTPPRLAARGRRKNRPLGVTCLLLDGGSLFGQRFLHGGGCVPLFGGGIGGLRTQGASQQSQNDYVFTMN